MDKLRNNDNHVWLLATDNLDAHTTHSHADSIPIHPPKKTGCLITGPLPGCQELQHMGNLEQSSNLETTVAWLDG